MAEQNVRVLKETSNAVSMEVVLSEPLSPKPAIGSAEKSLRSSDDIRKKLEDAERRRSLNLEQRASVRSTLSKLEEVHARKAVHDQKFISSTKEALDQKIEVAEEKRVKILEDLKHRVKERLEKIADSKSCKENSEMIQLEELKKSIEEKLSTADRCRDQNLQAMVNRLQQHFDKVTQANAAQGKELLALRLKIDQQLQNAAEQRAAVLEKKVKQAQEEEKRVEQARLKKELNNTAENMEA